MAAFTCENCGTPTNKLIIPRDSGRNGKLHCPTCYESKPFTRTGLHDRVPGTTMTRGKWDVIGNRRTSLDDNRVIIDKRTGKETQY